MAGRQNLKIAQRRKHTYPRIRIIAMAGRQNLKIAQRRKHT